MPQPSCGTTSNTCTEGSVTNTGSLLGQCGIGCTLKEQIITDTRDCTNAQGTTNCSYNNGCQRTPACSLIQ